MRTKLPPSRLQLLRQVSLFRGLSEAELARIDRLVDDVELEAGHVLTREGRSGSEAFVIVSGTAAVTIGGAEMAMLGPGEVVGEMSLIDNAPRTATVTARTPMVVLVLDPRGFSGLLGEEGANRQVLRSVVRRLRALEAR
jgi:CRP-like cAMP-binding protein